jgi:antitoxin (DNA-binding transcriptional repressor) of toxin-antitoxin stability system
MLMKTTISLKQLRNDPREYIRLLNSGYEIDITEHRKTIAKSIQPNQKSKIQKGNAEEILRVIKNLPSIKTPFPKVDTVELIKQTRSRGYEEKRKG